MREHAAVQRDGSRRVGLLRWAWAAGAALFVLAIPVVLVGTNVRLLFGAQRMYDLPIDRYGVPAVTGIPKGELLRATRELRAYLFNDEELLDIRVTDARGQTVPLYSAREVLHMRDVKDLIHGVVRARDVALLVALGYVALRLVVERRDGLRALARLTWLGTLGFMLAGAAFGLAAAADFDRLFTRVHLLSFRNDLWQLDPRRDHLIQMFPFEFWVAATTLLIAITLAEAAVLAGLSRWYLWRAERGRGRASAPEGATVAG